MPRYAEKERDKERKRSCLLLCLSEKEVKNIESRDGNGTFAWLKARTIAPCKGNLDKQSSNINGDMPFMFV